MKNGIKKKLLSQIKDEALKLNSQTEDELLYKIENFKKGKNVISEWFALVQEISFRKIGLRHFETQLLAGLILNEGKIVEMKTGEGKTLVSTLPVSYNALDRKGVHVVTVNDYLAERDEKWMGKIYKSLGLTTGLIKSTSNKFQRQKSYQADITYVTNSELVFDYLRDISSSSLTEMVQRTYSFCLIDEIDSILIDEARTPLILSTPTENNEFEKLYLADKLACNFLKEIHFEIDEKRREINLTEKGYKVAIKSLGKKTLYDLDDPWILEILNALKAKYLFKKNKDYIIQNNKIFIVDEFTGRIMQDRRWNMGLHEAIEVKEKLPIREGTKAKVSITYQNFFPLYPKLAGMTGTAKTNEKEFKDIYNLQVISIPSRKPLCRKDFSDLVFQNERAKWLAVVKQSKTCFSTGQPILIGTGTIEKSELLSQLFTASKIPHQVLNAKPENIRKESEIIAQAGKKSAITIATNMAGRGTDIILGGNPEFEVKQQIKQELWNYSKFKTTGKIQQLLDKYENKLGKLKKHIENLPYSLDECEIELKEIYEELFAKYFVLWEKDNLLIKKLGGLFVLGTERHETQRIDNQLRGRAGRQGDPGISQFFVSLEDELIKIFAPDNLRAWIKNIAEDENMVLNSSFLTKSLENAQKKVEDFNYEIRKNIFQYDKIINYQRKLFFKIRYKLLIGELSEEFFLRYHENAFDNKNFYEIQLPYSSFWKKNINFFANQIWITNDLFFAQSNFYQVGFFKTNNTRNILKITDLKWTNHIERLNSIRETINWRSYGQENPLVEYNYQASKSFQLMLQEIGNILIYSFLNSSL